MNFPEISLSRLELLFLKKLRRGGILLTDSNRPALDRLLRLGLARPGFDPLPEKCRRVFLSDLGSDYLAFLDARRSEHRTETIRYCITTVIAVLALVLSAISLAAQLGSVL